MLFSLLGEGKGSKLYFCFSGDLRFDLRTFLRVRALCVDSCKTVCMVACWSMIKLLSRLWSCFLFNRVTETRMYLHCYGAIF